MVQLASDYSSKVIDQIKGPNKARRQVKLEVTFAEVSKQAMTELGTVLHYVNPLDIAGNDRGPATILLSTPRKSRTLSGAGFSPRPPLPVPSTAPTRFTPGAARTAIRA
jgi:hypothetical protein